MKNDLINFVLFNLDHFGYLIIALVSLFENIPVIGYFIPGSIIVILAGLILPYLGLHLGTAIAVCTLGVIMGDGFGFFLGRFYGAEILRNHGHRVGLDRARLARMEIFFKKWGGWAVIIGRFSIVLRPLTPAWVGAHGLSQTQFWIFNIAGGIAWSVAHLLVGYYFGLSIPAIQNIILESGYFG